MKAAHWGTVERLINAVNYLRNPGKPPCWALWGFYGEDLIMGFQSEKDLSPIYYEQKYTVCGGGEVKS